MRVAELINKIKAFNEDPKRNWDQGMQLEDIVKAISIEVAELMEHFQWEATRRKRGTVKEKNWDEIGEEVADIFIYLARFCYIAGIDLVKVVLAKLKKNSTRTWNRK